MALKISSGENFSSKELMDAIWQTILKLFGEYGASKIGLTLIDYYVEKRLAIIRVAHTEVENVRASLASITKIVNEPAVINVLAVSGTLRALREKIKSLIGD